MELSSTRSNIIYTLFLLVTIPTFFMLITSRAWYDKANKNYSEDYNTTCSIGGYYIKISNAVYVTDKDYLQFTYSVKEIDDGTAEGDEPVVKSVWLDSENRSLEFDVGNEEISKTVVCHGAGTDFKKVIVKVSFKEADTVIPEKYDEFGDVIPGSTEEGEEIVERITIDKKDIQFISSDDLATMTTTKAVMTVDNSSENSSAATDYSRLPVVSIIPQTTTQTAKSSTAAPTTSTTQRSNNTKSTSTTTAEQSPTATEQIADTTSKQTTYKQPSAATTYHAAVTHSETTTSKNTTAATTTKKTSTSKVTSTTAKTTKKTTHTTTQSTTIFIPVKGIKLSSDYNANNIVLAVNQSTTVTAVISPSSATNKNVVWTSNRNDIASVDAAGKITAHSSGKAIITATTQDGNLTASCMVSVS